MLYCIFLWKYRAVCYTTAAVTLCITVAILTIECNMYPAMCAMRQKLKALVDDIRQRYTDLLGNRLFQ